jgi:hypothetical protein
MKEHQGMKAVKPTTPGLVEPSVRTLNIGKAFSSIPPWALFALILVAGFLVVSIGAWVGHQRFLSGARELESPIRTAVGAILSLLAFMLGFTFSLTWSRFSSRNSLVIAQAKAIGACYLRTSLIPEVQKQEARRLLREYLQILLGLRTTDQLENSLARIDELHVLIWQQTASLVREDMDSGLRSMFVSSVDVLLSLFVERKTIALVYRIPDAIWGALLVLAAMGMFAFGYQTGMSGVRKIFEMTLLPVAFGLVIVLIADLDSRSLQRRFRVSQNPLHDVMGMMEKNVP